MEHQTSTGTGQAASEQTKPGTPGKPAFVSVTDLVKAFGPSVVLHKVSLDIRAGEILVLLGPNGAGKSTLLNIIGGTLNPTLGGLALDGEPVDFALYNGAEARARGIQRVFQELSTFPNLTVAENLGLTAPRQQSRRDIYRDAERRMQAFPGNQIPVRAEMGDLSVAERQMVEITRAMTEDGLRLVILDEPTSALSSEEADQLGMLVTRKAAEGVAVVYVTHKLEEALRLADRIVVLRDGKLHWDGDGRSLTHDHLLGLLGATIEHHTPVAATDHATGQPDLLRVDHLTTASLRDVSVRVNTGEIVGIAGLEGAGQRDLLQAIFEARGRSTGAIRSATDIAYVSGDRKREGLLPLWSVEQNVGISAVPNHARFGLVDFARLKTVSQSWLADLGLTHRAQSEIGSLSGGNQQRALLGRALASEAPLLLLDDPTRGVDVNAKASIYEILDKLKDKGRSAILYSTEVAEFKKCDRVYVMARGHIAAEFSGADATEERIVQASFVQPDQMAQVAQAEVARTKGQGAFGRVAGWRGFPAAILMLAMFALAFWLQPRAFSTFGFDLLLQASLPLAFAVVAQLLFLMGGDLDLGLGFAVGLANVLAATYLVDAPMIGVLALAGLIAGYVILALIVELAGVSSVVVTLGASFVWLGIGLMIRETPGGAAPDWLHAITAIKLWPLPLPVYALVIAAVIGLWVCFGWRYSTRLRAFGNNKRTYAALGYSTLAARVAIYALAGTFAVISGLLITATTGSGNINVAASYTLSTVAAVVVGGASFAGGLVSPVGAIIAVAGLSLITTNLVFLGVSSEYATAIGGLVLILTLSLKSVTRPQEL